MTKPEIVSATASIRRTGARLLEPATAWSLFNRFDRSWKMRTKKFPYSCTDEEGMLLYLAIVANHLSSGFEISTAFGYSSAYIASAFAQTGGHLTTLDCYIEESEGTAEYEWDDQWDTLLAKTEETRKEIDRGKLPDGLALAKTLAKELNYVSHVSFQVGVSPRNVPDFVSGLLDFAFIDGGHYGEQPTLDFEAIKSHLSSKCVVFFHDHHGSPSIARAVEACAAHLGTAPIILPTLWHLTLVGRDLDASYLKQLSSLCPPTNRVRRRLSQLFAGGMRRLGFKAFQ
jgi:hypothetical protein